MVSTHEIVPERIRPLRRVEYDQLVELGVFEEERVELLRGAIVTMSPTSPGHDGTGQLLDELLRDAIGKRASFRIQFSFAATDDSQPLPDIAVVPRGDYLDAHPSTAHLLVEISYSSLKVDLGLKTWIYAEAGVPEYWVVNLVDEVVEVFTEPSPEGYRAHRRAARGETIQLVAFPDVVLDVDAILPPR